VALTELETARVRKAVGAFIERRRPPPPHSPGGRPRVSGVGQSVEIFEVRQAYGGAPGEKSEIPVAKATFIRPARAGESSGCVRT